jgi:hypothetical protein
MRLSAFILFSVAILNLEASAAANRVVVFIPGLYGSELTARDGNEVYWASAGKMIFGSGSIHLCHNFLGGPCPELEASAILEKITVLPWLYSVDAYGSTVDSLNKLVGEKSALSTFFYDWRMDLSATAAELAMHIRKLQSQYDQIDVVAHSMGGLILNYYLMCGDQGLDKCRPDANRTPIRRMVIAGAPFRGAVTSFYNMLHGRKFALNSTIMNARAYGSFPSIFQLLPLRQSKVLDHTWQSFDQAITDPLTWKQDGWGVFSDPQLLQDSDEAERFIENNLRRALRFHDLLGTKVSRSGNPAQRLLVVQGIGQPTLDKVIYRRHANGKHTLVYDSEEWPADLTKAGHDLMTPGDETVVQSSSAPSESLNSAFATVTATTKARHGEMFLDEELITTLKNFLDL